MAFGLLNNVKQGAEFKIFAGFMVENLYLCKSKRFLSRTMRVSFLRFIFLIYIFTFATNVWGQTDYSGTYYLAMPGTGSYNSDTPASNYYLVPTQGWCYYVATNSVQEADNGQPFLTTYMCGHVSNAKWIIQKHETENKYYIIHFADGRYLTYNGQLTGAGENRARVHLETSATGNNNLFAITKSGDNYFISHESGQYLNVTDGNKDSYAGAAGKTDGPTGYEDVSGIIGRWKEANNTSQFRFEPATSIDAPIITNNNDGTFTITAAAGATIYYTTDGTTPTTSTTTTGTTPVTVTQTASMTVIKAIAKAASDAIATDATTYELPECDAPAISFDNTTSLVSISGVPAGCTFYYTLDGGTPTASSTQYSAPFSVSSVTTVKAIATKLGYVASTVTEFSVSQVATPSIQNNGSNAISITSATADATIYYTTDGSTPTTSSAEYTAPLTENVSNAIIQAIAVKAGMITSVVGSGQVKLRCATPVITREGMTFTLSCSMPTDANLYYSLDGGSEVAYPGTPVPFTIDQQPIILTAVARHSDYMESETASMELKNGTGTPSDPFLIYGNSDFSDFVSDVNAGTTASACYKLCSDVSASGFTTIATTFSGVLEADINPQTQMPYRITGLDAPLFATLTGTVKNLVLEDVSISSGDNDGNTGAIACKANSAARIYNVGILSGEVGGTGNTGGLVGYLDGTARVINCYSFADITGGSNVGGIVGYNNVTTNSDAANLKTMVMNCMFYGDITGSSTISPVYGGNIISNAGNKGVGNYNYFRLEAPFVQPTGITYNCALGAEDRFLKRFEFYRLLLNGHRELAGWWATGTYSSSEMLKWVLETADRTIDNPKPYPVLKVQGRYPSIANYDADHAPTLTLVNGKPREEDRNKGGKFGTLTVNIQMGDGAVYQRPSGAAITTSQLTLNITDKDPDRFNFNYYKVQLPYYNDVGTKNYNGNRVVTGWKIVSITGGKPGTFTASDTWGGYNFADRNCTNKDLYGTGGSNRIFNQGAYWDVPEGVTSITIEPYWAKCVYLADPNADKVYNTAMETGYDVPRVGGGQIYTNGNSYSIAGENQVVYTTMGNAISSSNSTGLYVGIVGDPNKQTVYDYAVVLVGNYHHFNSIEDSKAKPYTVTSIDLDGDNEPDYSYILRFNGRTECHPVRADFINMPGFGMAQKSTGGTGSYNFGIMIPKGWFESTNTSLFRVTQFEYENQTRSETDALIVQGGVMEQWVSYNQKGRSNKIPYIHVGGNVWFKEFHTGCHQDKNQSSGSYRFQPTKHSPISVTGGDFDEFYLTGLYVANAGLDNYADNAECYINGGRFGTVCGAAMEGIGKANGDDNTGNISWLIQNADIREFYAGGLNAAKPVTGNLSTTIVDSHVDIFCGGPKFGDMSANKTVVTNATGCTFGTFFGAGYGGNSYSRQAPRNHNSITNFPHNDTSNPPAGYHASWNAWLEAFYTQEYSADYGGVSTQFNYQFLPMSDNKTNVARILVDFVKFSLATTHNVTSTLTGCTITNNFYGGGSLGKVDGSVTSTLDGCTVNGSAFGAGYSASLPTVEADSIGFRVEPYYYDGLGTYRTGLKGVTTTYRWEHGNSISIDKTNHILYTTEDLTTLGTVTGKATLNIKGNSVVEGKVFNEDGTVKEITGGVFGGGDASAALGDTEVNINGGTSSSILNVFGGGNRADVGGSVTVNMQNGFVNQSLYGGGALANTNINNVTAGYGSASETIPSTSTNKTVVNLLGGTIHGNAYGGGLGRLSVTASAGEKYTQEEINAAQEGDPAYGKTTNDWKVEPVEGVTGVAALVYGDVNVNLGSSGGSSATAFTTSYYTGDHTGVVKSGRVFGCNNLNGSPKGEVTVTVYKTVPGNVTRTAIDKLKLEETDDGYLAPTYELTAVYGGGNLANFTTPVTGKKANVIIETCDVSIRDVYGGGNAAAVPETNVLVKGAYEIQEVFGGGNGKDPYTLNEGSSWVENPGANVNGNANTLLTGGYIHEAYGGSNEKGTITGNVTIDVGTGGACDLDVEKIVGAGKNADISGDLIMTLGCKPDVKVPLLFCGADNANVHGNVETTITSGKFGKVFGGNNQGGAILGHIKLNIEETGDCEVPIEIDELYLGGNEAAYSVYGYYDAGTSSDGKPIYLPRTAEMHAITDTSDENYKAPITNPAADSTHTFPYTQPELNIISCTYIGKTFGGGLGAGAAMYANPTVNINMVPGSFANNTTVGVPAKMTALGLNSSDNPNNLGVLVDVYGGGNRAAVHGNTTVNIGTQMGQPITLTSTGDTPDVVGAFVSGTVYGAGKGVATNPNAAIVTGNTLVNMAGGHVSRSIYGGGELGSVGTFTDYWSTKTFDSAKEAWHFENEPKTCQPGTGLTKVLISGGQVGLVNQLMPDPNNPTSDDDYGYVFCASKGIADSTAYSNANLLAVSDSSYLEISGGLIAASAYGGSENGEVLRHTHVKISGGQIGSGHYKVGNEHHWDAAYTDAQWTTAINAINSGVAADINAATAPFHQCDAWPFGPEGNRKVYDYFANEYNSQGGAKPGSDGHSYYGHVFGGGSGYYPYAPGQWRRSAGRVCGNTLVEISGGHILTNVYGGNEITDVLGHSKVHMTGGTVGVPRTIDSIQARPVNSYIFGAGMGDPRVMFNGWSNVGSSEVIVEGNAVVFGSVFGGGEDGHVLGDVSTTIRGNALIGTFGSSGVDGNIFGSGRGFSALALTAGAVCGNVTVNISENAKILGSVFGGGRMAAVGTHLVLEDHTNYGVLIPDGKNQVLYGNDVDALDATHGYVTINITGGTIGNPSQMVTSQYSIGDVFGGSKGTLMSDWSKTQMLGLVKNTEVNISQAEGYTTRIYGNVYGGGELASVGSYNYATSGQASTYNSTHTSENMYEGDVFDLREAGSGLAKILIMGGTIGQNTTTDTKGSVFGGCLGKAGTAYSGYSFVNNSDVTLQGGTVYGCVFGGGENGHVLHDTDVKIKSGTVGIALDKASLPDADLNANMIYRGNVYGGGRGIDPIDGGGYSITAGKVAGNTNVTVEGGTIYRNVYGGGSLASVGVREEEANQSLVTDTHPFPYNTGLATVTIKGGQIGTDGGASANNYNTLIPDRDNRRENGFVFGSGRGMAAGAQTTSTLVQLAYTKNTLVSIEGTANVTGSVFGGGENGHVKHNTRVNIKENCFVGTELNDDEHLIDDNGRGRLLYRGNVYGGGRGIDTGGDDKYSLTAGRVYGDTYVEVSGGKIYHDVFGGGSLASVGNETVNATTGEVSYGDDSGETEVHIKGGIIGYSSTASKQGFNCGFVYGGCRGLSAASNSEIVKMAYVHDTKVYIEPGADVKGSVFGGGANGHVKNDTYVEISGGSIGTALLADEVGFDDHGVAVKPVFRGNVYAGGRGVDQYYTSGSSISEAKYSLSAGAVYGNAELLMTGGHVWHNIYGSGAMASVGTVKEKAAGQHVHDEVVDKDGIKVDSVIYNPDERDINYLTGVFVDTTGIVRVTITGGTVGDTTPGHEGLNNGSVYGAGRGVSADRSDYVASMEYVNKTFVTIGTENQQPGSYSGSTAETLNYPYIYGAVFGGGENGHVKTDTDVRIHSGIIGWPLVEGTNKMYTTNADGSTKNPYIGNVFGGGRGVDPVHHQTGEQRSSSAGRVYGHTNLTMSGGLVRRAIYGGGLLASVGVYRLLVDDMHITDMIEDKVDGGDATINITGGYVGNVDTDGSALGTGYLIPGDNNGFVFGSSCGMVADDYVVGQDSVDIQYRQMGYTHSTHVSVSGANTKVFGCVFGSGENGHVWENSRINIRGGQIGSDPTVISRPDSTTIYIGNVYGSGRGVDHPHKKISETAGKVRGNTTVNVVGGTVWRDVYGGGSLASVGEANETAADSKKHVTNDPTTNNPFPYATGLTRVVIDTTAVVRGSVYGSGRGVASTDVLYKQAAYVKNTLVTVRGNARVYQNVFGGGNAGHVRKDTDVTIDGSAKVDGNVYGGGAGAISSSTAGLVDHDVKVGIKGGVIAGDVYGGGAIANTNVHDIRNTAITSADCNETRNNAKTIVDLLGGIILGNAYGGGQGVIPPSGATAAEVANAGAMVQGDVTVTLNGTAFYPTTKKDDKNNDLPATGRVFGCNNLNGSPQGTVLVKVLKTVGLKKSDSTYTVATTKPTKDTDTYEVEAVYGGGNLAAYVPWDGNATGQYSEGGIVATKNPLQVVIDGCEDVSIDYVYGGGNAASAPSTQVTVLGAYELGHVFGGGNGKDRISNDGQNYTDNPGAHVGLMAYPNADGDAYGTKEERATNYGYGTGKTHVMVYGGTVHEVYGGSNTKGNVRVEARATLEDKGVCYFDLGEAYGGGRNAEMDGDAVLEIGCIRGLGKAYGGAAEADVNGNVVLNITNGTYGQVFGGNDRGGNISGSITVNIEETGCNPIIIGELYGGGNLAAYNAPAGINSPVVNVKSFTSIGTVYGGGYGAAAEIKGNPTVNIDEVHGIHKDTVIYENSRVIGSTVKKPGDTGYDATVGFAIPSHAKDAIGAIGTVFGGGNEAKVIGNTTVNIGTLSKVKFVSLADDASTANVDESEPDVVGVDIRGNVFGGGNQAEVTGNTNVVVGKKQE